ncbi:MAG: nitronate monooxygenase [SAR202 cluster bacterium]|nr:nitronate monooxygenase [SAR202 cluster bacterium]MDP6513313.1 nitronate monooxygenase [SAR202 cluster bacterium]
MTSANPLHTRICDVFECEFPIMNAGMDVAGPELVAAVCNAGGFGSLGTGRESPEALRREIRKVKLLTDKPFAVQLMSPSKARVNSIAREQALPEEHVLFVKGLQQEFNIPEPKNMPPRPEPADPMELMQVAWEEDVPFWVCFFGSAGEGMVKEAHAHGMTVINSVGNTRHVEKCLAMGVDAFIATGYEGGAHRGDIGTMALIPQVVDAADGKPVLAAGGIADGRGLVAALALGAEGVTCGTAFLLSPECGIWDTQIALWEHESNQSWYVDAFKKQLIEAKDHDTNPSHAVSGGPLRTLNNEFTGAWKRPEAPETLPMGLQPQLIRDSLRGAFENQRIDLLPNAAGQIIGMIDHERHASQVIYDIMSEAVKVLERVSLPGQ